MKKAVIVFVRNPELGKVKTRLARDVGEEMALKIYKELLRHTREVLESAEVNRFVFYSEKIEHKDSWTEDKFEKRLQSEGNLGQKMQNAFEQLLKDHDRVVIIGSDCPQIHSDIINEAFNQLETVDISIGPSMDGGYYLLGMKQCHSQLFQKMNWSTEYVFQETVNRIRQLDLSYELLPVLSDVDYKKDWIKHGWKIEE